MTYILTPADVMELRASVRWRLSDQSLGGPTEAGSLTSSIPFICYARDDRMAMNAPGYHPDAFVLHTEGHLRAISKRIEVLGACLRCEFAEPGFTNRIMDARVDCEEATLTPDEAAGLRSRRLFEEKAVREYAAEEARRKAKLKVAKPTDDPSTVTPDDIFDD